MAYGGISLRACYAMPGTPYLCPYWAMPGGSERSREGTSETECPVIAATGLRACYAMSGTDAGVCTRERDALWEAARTMMPGEEEEEEEEEGGRKRKRERKMSP
eukprot:1572054-Rhodomonas_salina.2